jgi:hypothetical protein
MRRIADRLPPEIPRQAHPDRRKNEAEYWTKREQDWLLETWARPLDLDESYEQSCSILNLP